MAWLIKVYELFLFTYVFLYNYRMRAIITRGLYIFYSILEGQNGFLRSFFHKILTLCTVSIQERFMIKSGLWWRAYGTLVFITNSLS